MEVIVTAPHILVIEGYSLSLELLQEFLDLFGATYTLVQDAAILDQTLENLKTPVDVVLLDLDMPAMNGYQGFEMLQQRLGSAVPIVACAGRLNEINLLKEIGFHSFVAKPLQFERFSHQLQRILQNESVWERR